MDIDILTVICIIAAVIVGAVVYKVFNSANANKVDMVFDKLKLYFNKYGQMLEDEDPELYKRVKCALETIEAAYTDGSISPLEALEIASKFYPVFEELVAFAQGKKKA